LLYPDEMPLVEKIRTIAKEIYRAKDISADKPVRDQLSPVRGRWATASCRSASPRPSTASRPMRHQGRARATTPINVREVQALRRRRVRGGDLRRDHDHARPAAGARRRLDRCRADGKIVGLF
jgi:hypothetical protein